MSKGTKITMLTERKIIGVRPGTLLGSPDRIEVDVCLVCGAVVFDIGRHDRWHMAEEGEGDTLNKGVDNPFSTD